MSPGATGSRDIDPDRDPPAGGRGSGVSALNVSSFIWGIADDVLRDVYVRGKYRDVILPMTVLRRLDAVLEPTKDAVLRMKARLDAAGVTNQDAALRQASGEAFYNTSSFRLRDLTSRGRQQQLRADFEAYLDGFRPTCRRFWRSSSSATRFPRWWKRTRWASCSRNSWTIRSTSAPAPS